MLVAAFLGVNPQLLEALAGAEQEPQSLGTAPACLIGADADARVDCRITGRVNSPNAFCPDYQQQYNVAYPQAGTVISNGGTKTGCGPATSL